MDFGSYFQFLVALVFVLALIGLLAWGYRHFALGHKLLGRPRKETRLEIIEIKHVDAKRKLVLLRRDDTEHLMLLGPTSETLIEAGIDARSGDQPAKEAVE
ncbi:MAG: flagellar biosynthetic protein FliO [Candidatus Neomarinimicrobiota bacterium]